VWRGRGEVEIYSFLMVPDGTIYAGKKARRLKQDCVKDVCQLWQDHYQKTYEYNETLGRAQGIFVVGVKRVNAGWLHNLCRTNGLPGSTSTIGTSTTGGGSRADNAATDDAAATCAGAGGSGNPDGARFL